MNIKFKIVICLVVASIIATQETIVVPQESAYSINNLIYTPLAQYQQMLSDMTYNLMAVFLYKQTAAPQVIQLEELSSTEEVMAELSREEALESMKEITAKVFDSNDPDLLGKHLIVLKNLCQHLDPQIDQKTIAAITFLIDNQHKTGYPNLPFWVQAIKKHELETAIPMKPEVQKKPGIEKLSALNKKMAFQLEHLKKEQAAGAQQALLLA